MSGEFKPRIVVFACNWCSYAGADTAGISRMQYPASNRLIRTMCSARVDEAFVLRALQAYYRDVTAGPIDVSLSVNARQQRERGRAGDLPGSPCQASCRRLPQR